MKKIVLAIFLFPICNILAKETEAPKRSAEEIDRLNKIYSKFLVKMEEIEKNIEQNEKNHEALKSYKKNNPVDLEAHIKECIANPTSLKCKNEVEAMQRIALYETIAINQIQKTIQKFGNVCAKFDQKFKEDFKVIMQRYLRENKNEKMQTFIQTIALLQAMNAPKNS